MISWTHQYHVSDQVKRNPIQCPLLPYRVVEIVPKWYRYSSVYHIARCYFLLLGLAQGRRLSRRTWVGKESLTWKTIIWRFPKFWGVQNHPKGAITSGKTNGLGDPYIFWETSTCVARMLRMFIASASIDFMADAFPSPQKICAVQEILQSFGSEEKRSLCSQWDLCPVFF